MSYREGFRPAILRLPCKPHDWWLGQPPCPLCGLPLTEMPLRHSTGWLCFQGCRTSWSMEDDAPNGTIEDALTKLTEMGLYPPPGWEEDRAGT